MNTIDYIPAGEARKTNVRFRYTHFGIFYFLRSVWRMEVTGTLLFKFLFAVFCQLLILTLPALAADIVTLLIIGIGAVIYESYVNLLRPVIQALFLGAVSVFWRIISWAGIIILLIFIYYHFGQIRTIIENIAK